jgi:hypothetical protein
MALKKATFDIGTCNYLGWPWDIGSVDKPHWHLSLYFSIFDQDLKLRAST